MRNLKQKGKMVSFTSGGLAWLGIFSKMSKRLIKGMGYE